MKRIHTLICFISVFSLLGCASGGPRPVRVKTPETASVIARHEAKDVSVVVAAEEAQKIAPEVAPQVEAIKAAVASAPAAEIKTIVDSYEKIVGELTTANAKLTKRAEEAEDKFSRWVRGGLFALGALVFGAGIAIAVLGSKVPMFGPVAGVSVSSGGSGIFALAMLYDFTVKHPFGSACMVGIFLLIGGTLIYANHHHSKSP
jgi:hypothetical protein